LRVTCGVDTELERALLAEPAGRMDAHGATIVHDAVSDRLSEKTPSLLLDMGQVEYLSSAGISTLIRLLTRTRELGGTISVFNCRPVVRSVIKVVAIDPVLNVRGTANEARERLKELGAG
jgi:anti-anti-sigma factor